MYSFYHRITAVAFFRKQGRTIRVQSALPGWPRNPNRNVSDSALDLQLRIYGSGFFQLPSWFRVLGSGGFGLKAGASLCRKPEKPLDAYSSPRRVLFRHALAKPSKSALART